MQFDLWQRRAGWIGLAGVILFCGAVAQTRFAAADDGDDPVAPLRPQNFSFVLDDQPAQAPGQNQELRANNWRMQMLAPIDGQNQRPWEIVRRWAGSGETGKYWIGVECHEAQPELRAQLSLGEDEGLVVVRVLKDSPADKAGVQTHDVIVTAGDNNLSQVPDLQKAVEAADGKELTLKTLRKGKERVLHLSPAERPQDQVQLLARPGGMGMVVPGMNFNMAHVQLPDNVSVSINRQGNKPASITIKRGDEKWEVTDQELNKLPDDLRPSVERMLGVGPIMLNLQGGTPGAGNPQNVPQIHIETAPKFRWPNRAPESANPPVPGMPPAAQPNMAPPPMPGAPGAPRPPVGPPGDASPDIMQRLEALDRSIRMLQDEIRGMRDGGPNGDRRGPPPGEPGRPAPRENPPVPGGPPGRPVQPPRGE